LSRGLENGGAHKVFHAARAIPNDEGAFMVDNNALARAGR
jgi:hypothetical protein